MPSRTAFLSKLLGLYCILVALSMMTHKQLTVDTVTAILHNAPLLLFLGVITTLGGLAMILAHNVWSGGALPVVVTVLGWLTLIKGLLFLFLSPETESNLFLGGLHYAQYFYGYVCFSLLLGVYLTYGGFSSTARQSA